MSLSSSYFLRKNVHDKRDENTTVTDGVQTFSSNFLENADGEMVFEDQKLTTTPSRTVQVCLIKYKCILGLTFAFLSFFMFIFTIIKEMTLNGGINEVIRVFKEKYNNSFIA